MQNLLLFRSSTVRKSADQAKDAKNALRKKYPFILYYLPSGGTQVREPSVYYSHAVHEFVQ